MKIKVVCIVQARLGSKRFPRKVLEQLGDGSLLESVVHRVRKSKELEQIVLAIPDTEENLPLGQLAKNLGVDVFKGSERDVQLRYLDAAVHYGASHIVRVTADCPLIDWQIIDKVVKLLLSGHYDYVSNIYPPTFPDGLDVEAFSLAALKNARDRKVSALDSEHVTVSLRESGGFKVANVENDLDFSWQRWTVDYPDDLAEIRSTLPGNFKELTFAELLNEGFQGAHTSGRTRNEGVRMLEGQKIWSRAKKVIPGGSMLLSKRAEMFLPERWPTYYSKAKGISVWDLEGQGYLDFATMSVGTCSLGYGVDRIDDAVKGAIDSGVMSTLNSPAEVELAERLVSLHPWAAMARFARSGGEANAMAVRIARAFTGKEKIAVCGYHGWHDWYLAANLDADSNLDGHLLPGLEPAGVPRSLVGTTMPFDYNDTEGLEKMLRTGEFAAVQMEVSRSFGPEVGFLERVRELCSLYGVVLIFDECTSGFRETFGGLHLKYGVQPDIAMFGKALGNGYAISAVIGRENVMQSAQSTFISSTFWTERLGPVAALATLAEMERQRSWEVITQTGRDVKSIWQRVFANAGFDYAIGGLDALPTFSLNVSEWPTYRTLIIQEMLKKGFLVTSGFYASTAHTANHLTEYETALGQVIQQLSQIENDAQAKSILEGPVAHTGFKRLN